MIAIAMQIAKSFTGFLDIGERDARDKNRHKIGAFSLTISTISVSFVFEIFFTSVLVNRGHELRILHSFLRSYI